VVSLYLLDTDTCSYLMRRSSASVITRAQRVPLAHQVISVVTIAELLFGVRVSRHVARDREAYESFTSHVNALDWTKAAAEEHADIYTDLRARGELIGANDLLIAAHARSLNAILVTNNTREFRRVKRLKIENWAA
jgi:tRNA(fMet)-specific endonuclease VapC